MASINKAIIIGRLGKDPQINTFQNGSKIATFTVATSERWTDKQTGEKKERTEWHNIAVTSPALVSLAERYLRKGNQVYIEGSFRTREYTDNNGIKRYMTEIVVPPYSGNIQLIESNPSGCQPQQSDYPETFAEPANEPTATPDTYDDMDDDIPF